MVGPCGLEPQTSTVSKRRHYVLTITYKAPRTALVRANTAKTKDLQVKLQVRNSRSDAARVHQYTTDYRKYQKYYVRLGIRRRQWNTIQQYLIPGGET